MRYLTAIPVFLFLVVMDVIITVTFLPLIIVIDARKEYPFSYNFAKNVWFKEN